MPCTTQPTGCVVLGTGASAFTCEGRGKPLSVRSFPGTTDMNNIHIKRTRILTVRFTTGEYTKLETMAHAAKVELSSYVRSVLLGAEIPKRARGKSPNIAALGQALVALNRIANNINQVARQCNISGNALAYEQAKADRDLLAAAAKAVVAAMDSSS